MLIDQSSEVSLISEALIQRLRLSRSRSAVEILGINDKNSGPSKGKVTLNVASLTTETNFTARAFILPRLSLYQGANAKINTE